LATFTPSAHPGARLPHAWLPGGRSVFDLLGDGLSLLRLMPGEDDDLVAAAARRGIPLTLVDLTDVPGMRSRYGADLLLVRPDQHVAWRGDAVPEPDALLGAVLGEVLCPDGAPNVAQDLRLSRSQRNPEAPISIPVSSRPTGS
jgi:hypothetical protein